MRDLAEIRRLPCKNFFDFSLTSYFCDWIILNAIKLVDKELIQVEQFCNRVKMCPGQDSNPRSYGLESQLLIIDFIYQRSQLKPKCPGFEFRPGHILTQKKIQFNGYFGQYIWLWDLRCLIWEFWGGHKYWTESTKNSAGRFWHNDKTHRR